MALVGVKFKQIGPVVDYHGQRAPFYISGEALRKNLKPTFVKMFANIEKKVLEDLSSPIPERAPSPVLGRVTL